MLKPVQRIPSYRLLLIGELDFRGFVAFVADSVVMREVVSFSQTSRSSSAKNQEHSSANTVSYAG